MPETINSLGPFEKDTLNQLTIEEQHKNLGDLVAETREGMYKLPEGSLLFDIVKSRAEKDLQPHKPIPASLLIFNQVFSTDSQNAENILADAQWRPEAQQVRGYVAQLSHLLNLSPHEKARTIEEHYSELLRQAQGINYVLDSLQRRSSPEV